MPTCSVCKRKALEDINRDLRAGMALRKVGKKYDCSFSSLARRKRKCLPDPRQVEFDRLGRVLHEAILKAQGRNDVVGIAALVRERRALNQERASLAQVADDKHVTLSVVYESGERTNPYAIGPQEERSIKELYGLSPADLGPIGPERSEPPASTVSTVEKIVPVAALPEPATKPPAPRRREPARQPSAGGIVESESKLWPHGLKTM